MAIISKGSVELRQERARVLERMEALASAGEREQRNLTSDEEREWTQHEARALQLAADIKSRELLERTPDPKGEAFYLNGHAAGHPGSVHGLRPEQRMTDHLAPRWADRGIDANDPDLRLSDWLAGVVTGSWRGKYARELRDMSVGNQVAGGFLVPDPLSARILDLVRAESIVVASGAETVPMDSATLNIGRITSDPTASWKAENAAITSSDVNVGVLVLQAKTLVGLVKTSVEWAEDALGGADVIERGLSKALALELDRGAIRGAGGLEPTGVLSHNGVVQTALGTSLTYDGLLQAVDRMRQNNHQPNAVWWHPAVYGAFQRLKDGEGAYLANQPHPDVAALRQLSSTQIPGTSGSAEVYVVDGTKIMIGMRTELIIEASRVAADATNSAFSNLQVWFRAYLRADVMLQYAAAAEVLTTITV